MAAAWALEDTKFFTRGCRNLVLTTDHKPLVKILGDRALDEIHNPRLFRLKQRTLMWQYRIVHVPGKSNAAADATSRYPGAVESEEPDQVEDTSNESLSLELAALRMLPHCEADEDDIEVSVIAAVKSQSEFFRAVTWERVQQESRSDSVVSRLVDLIAGGFPTSRDRLPEEIQPYWQYRDQLYQVDEVVMMNNRVIIPEKLRGAVLKFLHAAHQSTGKMGSRTLNSVFWPGMSTEVKLTRDKCTDCWRVTHPCNHTPHQ